MNTRRKILYLLNIAAAVFFIAIILLVNYEIIKHWFGKNGPGSIDSIEVSYITMGRFITDFGFKTWIPFWYFGFPFHLFYTPLLPFLEACLHTFYHMPFWVAYRLITGIGFILAPVSVFFLGWQLSKKVIGGAIAGILFTISPFSATGLETARFSILTRWGEGPHTLSLVFVPLVGFFLARYFERKKLKWAVLSALCLAGAALTNALGLFSSLLLLAAMTFVKITQHHKQTRQVLLTAFGIGLLALGLISFWYNLSFIQNFFAEGGKTGKLLKNLFPWGWLMSGLAIFALYTFFSKYIRNFAIGTAILWYGVFFAVVYIYNTQNIEILPQALRYTVEMDMSLALLIGVSFVAITQVLAKHIKKIAIIGNIIGIIVFIWCIKYIEPFFYSQQVNRPIVNINQTGEYTVASWLKDHTDETKGERVFVPGNYGFYLNWFTNTSQQRGGLYQAQIHPWPDHIYYQMVTGKNSQISHAWLTITNTKYAVITGDGTREVYNEVRNPQRFKQYKIVHEDHGDTIYEIPLKRPSLAKPVSLSKMQTLATPKKGDDKEALLAYADWVENSSSNENSLKMIDTDTYHITGEVEEGEGILVQMSYHSGWHAKDNISGKMLPVQADPMKFIIIYPINNKVDITLVHKRTIPEWLGYFISIGTIAWVIWLSFQPFLLTKPKEFANINRAR